MLELKDWLPSYRRFMTAITDQWLMLTTFVKKRCGIYSSQLAGIDLTQLISFGYDTIGFCRTRIYGFSNDDFEIVVNVIRRVIKIANAMYVVQLAGSEYLIDGFGQKFIKTNDQLSRLEQQLTTDFDIQRCIGFNVLVREDCCDIIHEKVQVVKVCDFPQNLGWSIGYVSETLDTVRQLYVDFDTLTSNLCAVFEANDYHYNYNVERIMGLNNVDQDNRLKLLEAVDIRYNQREFLRMILLSSQHLLNDLIATTVQLAKASM